jgi:hypothetical protein
MLCFISMLLLLLLLLLLAAPRALLLLLLHINRICACFEEFVPASACILSGGRVV